ncbi:Protein-L-isoaspartate O-methyltransferase [Caenispirillum salinarum AK4]|uniref:Protein-L-isoaspartate O-methyltransferase n=1 Tax=Caenispirillum salinarum AK4 TaxID=1238182 RepID=K9H204_9PROT|nr:protein-L-isoaspartate(D-aspartate) O-methyltransferase [Caenispirillum salinarum]EKV31582.1 Protein-L-isoaspartate O-methyltransferase [Caenispirillum salinarum AK4]
MIDETHKAQLIMELRRQGVADQRVLEVMERIPRELFVEDLYQDQSYANRALPIGCGQTISQPLVVGQMTQALQVDKRMKVLEIGTGSGYQASILARLCRRLYTIERHRPLLRVAEARFRQLGLHNIHTIIGDGNRGWPEQAPFDRIMVTAAAASEIPQTLLDQLKPGGIMILPVGPTAGQDQDLLRVLKDEDGQAHVERLFPVRFVPLVEGLPVGNG